MKKLLLLCMVLIGTSAAVIAADFWEKKEYSEWSEKEVRKVLFDSPWSRQVNVSLRGEGYSGAPPVAGGPGGGPLPGGVPGGVGPGPGQDQRGGVGGGGPRGAGGPLPGGGVGEPDMGSRSIPLLIRWQSALPVKQALVRASATPEGGPEQTKQFLEREETHYVIAVVGLPDVVVMSMGNPDQLAKAARIDRGKNRSPLIPEKVEKQQQDRQVTLYFFFPRGEPIALEDKSVEFVLTLREFDAKRQFKLQDMVYRGELAI
jgi:hypothetical protein